MSPTKREMNFLTTGETVYTFCDLTDNSTDENEPDKTVHIEQPEGI